MTLIMVQVHTASATLYLSTEQGEASPQGANNLPAGCIQLNNANTGDTGGTPVCSPPQYWWKGELWFSSGATPVVFSIVVVGEEDKGKEDTEYMSVVKNVGHALDTSNNLQAKLLKTLDLMQASGVPK